MGRAPRPGGRRRVRHRRGVGVEGRAPRAAGPPWPTPGSARTTCCWCGRWTAWTARASRARSGCCAASTKPGPGLLAAGAVDRYRRRAHRRAAGRDLSVMARAESTRRSERVKAGLARRKAEGKPIGRRAGSRIAGRASGRDTSPAGSASGQEERRAEIPRGCGIGACEVRPLPGSVRAGRFWWFRALAARASPRAGSVRRHCV